MMKLIHELIGAYAAAFPSRAAVIDSQGELSYGELEARTAFFARRLVSMGLRPGSAAAVYVPFCKEFIPGAVAVLRSGGVIVPFEYTYPPERLEYMLKDSEAGAILTTRQLWAQKPLSFPEDRVLFLDDPADEAGPFADCKACTDASPALLLYTSGTTGNPKGVLHTHSLLQHIADCMNVYDGLEMDGHSRGGIMSSFSFMAAEIIMWAPLLKGGTLCVVPEEARRDLAALDHFIREMDITHIFMPSGLAAIFAEDYDIRHVYVFAGGEKLRNFRAHCPGNALYNLYGSTEVGGALLKRIHGDEEHVYAGKPEPGIRAVIVDEKLKPVQDGEIGEILFSSDYMSRLYWKLPELTAEKWIEMDGKTWFRSGDRAMIAPGSDIDILGRIDNMVKLRGYRIETGEVEAQITRAIGAMGFPGVKQVVVTARTVSGTDHLVCYYEAPKELDHQAIAREISRHLTEYMIPDLWVQMDAFPRNANGKVLRRALPEPVQARQAIGALDSEVVARAVWTAAEVLGITDFISPDDRFTDLGGTSLSAMQYAARLREQGIRTSGARVLEINVLRKIAEAAEVAYEQLWTPEEYDRVRRDFAERGERILKVLPISARQDEMLFDQIIHPDRLSFRNVLFLQIDSAVSEEHLREALDAAAKENEVLRSAIVFRRVSVVQQVITDRRIPLTMMEADAFGRDEMEALRNQLLYAPLDLQQSCLMQVAAIHAEGMTFLCVMTHRIAFDRATLRGVLARMMRALEGHYPGDASIAGWRELIEAGAGAAAPEAPKAAPVAVRKDAPPEIFVYSENRGPKLVFVHTGNTGAEAYWQLAERIRGRVSFAVIEPFNLYHMDEARYGIRNIAAKYIEILKRHQPEGPYLLGGWCYGGVVAHEMACQLERAGEEVRCLFMLDSHALSNEALRRTSKWMFATINQDYFETSPLFADLRQSGMLKAMVTNAEYVANDMMTHEPSFFHGSVTYFKPAKIPTGVSGKNRRYWENMMKYLAGNYERYCSRDKLRVVVTPHEHDLMMDDASLDIIVPELLKDIGLGNGGEERAH